MPDFAYTGIDDKGKRVAGAASVAGEKALEARLREAGIWLVEARRLRRSRVASYVTHGHRFTANRRELITFLVQLPLLLNAGIPLVQALERLEDDFAADRLGPVINGLREQIVTGVPLHEAMTVFPRIFTTETVSLVRAGEASGTLPDVLTSIRRYLEWRETLQAEVRQAVTYPAIVILAVSALVFILFGYVVPRFEELFVSLHMQVPALTRAVMSVGRFVGSTWFVWLIVIVGLPAGIRAARRMDLVGVAIDRAKLRLPLFGELIQMFALSRLSHNLAMMQKAGIPLLRSLEISRALVGNLAISRALARVQRGVSEGIPMSRTMAGEPVFSKVLVTMLASGEASGKLDAALESVSEYYNSVIPRKIKTFFSLFEPAVMLLLIAVVGVVALSLILPILQLWEAAGA